MYGVYGTGNTETKPEGMFQGLANFLAAGGTIDEYMVRAFPQTAGLKNMKRFSAIPKSVLKNPTALRTGASKVAMVGAKRLPLLAGTLQTLGGDPIGGIGTGVGGVAGGVIGGVLTGGNPLGIAAGSFIGSGLGQSGTRALAGIDMSDPYSGPDISIPLFGGIPITPYAKTKKTKERARKELDKDMAAMDPYIQKQMGREMAAQQQVISGNILQTALGNARFGR